MGNRLLEGETKVKRDTSLDVIRIIALFCVISIHFFLNTDYYDVTIEGKQIYFMTLFRSFFRICVPLFLILSGYLKNQKVLNITYYKSFSKIAFVYILASIGCLIFRYAYLCEDISINNGFFSILNFNASEYAWYVEMYIGLLLLIPFLNILWCNLQRKSKNVLLISMLFLTALPGIFNIYDFDVNEWWQDSQGSTFYNKLLPDFWDNLYPVTYYFIGCFMYEQRNKLKKHIGRDVIILLAAAIILGSFCFFRSYGSVFKWGKWESWGALPVVIMSFFVFRLLKNMNFDKLPDFIKKILHLISDACFGGYLISFIFDQ